MSIKKRSKPKQYNQIHRLMKVKVRTINYSSKKERTKRNVRAEMRRYNPNYSAIYSNVHTVRISQPVYQKELHMIFQKKQEMQRAAKEEYDKLYKKIIKSKKEKAKKNNDMIQYSDLNNKIYDSEEITSRNYFKKEYSERDNKVRHHSINNSCNTNSKHHQLTKDNNNQTIEKKEKIKANSSRSAIKLKGLSFDKALGRDNYILKKKKEKEIIIDYNPNYDFIRSNTKKTCSFIILYYIF